MQGKCDNHPRNVERCHIYSAVPLYRGSYTSAHVLLNLLNELGKRDKMRGLPSILSLFRNKFNKFNDTGARMIDSIYHIFIALKLLKNHIFGVKLSTICYFKQHYIGHHYVTLLNL